MYNKAYTRGYFKMAVKCAQFSAPNPAAGKMYYAVSSDAQKRLDRRMNNINNAQKKYDSLNGWNPLNWGSMLSAKYQESHNKRELENEKKRIAADMAANSTPVDYRQMRNLSRYNGVHFLGVNEGDSHGYETTRDSLANGFNDYGTLRDITSGARAGRAAYDNSAAGQRAARARQTQAASRHATMNAWLLNPIAGAATYRQQAPQFSSSKPGQFAAQQRGYAR